MFLQKFVCPGQDENCLGCFFIYKKDIDKRRAVGFGSLWEVRGP